MGKAIVYCSGCGAVLRGEKAYRSGENYYCEKCRPADAEVRTPSSDHRKVSTGKVPKLDTPRAFRPAPAPKRSSLPIFVGAGAVALLILLGVAFSGGRPAPPPATPPVAKPPPPAAPPPVLRDTRPPPPPTFKDELAKLDEELKGPVEREDFPAAFASLDRARAKRSELEWTVPVDDRFRDVTARLNSLFAGVAVEAGAAIRSGEKAKITTLRSRVERWGRPDFVTEFDKVVAAAVEARPWQPVFDGKTTDFLKSGSAKSWEVRDGALVKVEENAAQTKQVFTDGELRIRFSMGDLDRAFFAVRQGGAGGHHRLEWLQIRERSRVNQIHEILFTFKGPDLKATFDGAPIEVQVTGVPSSGHLQFNGGPQFRLHSVEFRPPG